MLYAKGDCMHGLMFYRSPWCVKRRVLVRAGYHVISISLGEVNKRFCQSTAVMQSLVGDCSHQQHTFVTRTYMPVGLALGAAHWVVCWTYWI